MVLVFKQGCPATGSGISLPDVEVHSAAEIISFEKSMVIDYAWPRELPISVCAIEG